MPTRIWFEIALMKRRHIYSMDNEHTRSQVTMFLSSGNLASAAFRVRHRTDEMTVLKTLHRRTANTTTLTVRLASWSWSRTSTRKGVITLTRLASHALIVTHGTHTRRAHGRSIRTALAPATAIVTL